MNFSNYTPTEKQEVVEAIGLIAFRYTFAKSIQVITITIFFYYCVLTFEEERQYIWSRDWTWGKLIYLVTRYSGVLFNIIVCISMFDLPWNSYDDNNESFDWSLSGCILGYLYIGLGVCPILFAEAILEMRVYAVYRRRRAVLAFMIVLFIISLGLNVVQGITFIYDVASNICVGNCDEYASSLPVSAWFEFADYASCTSDSIPMSTIGWLVLSVIELILFIMILKKTRNDKKSSLLSRSTSSGDIVTVIANDSTSYFIIIFTVSVIGTCLSAVTEFQGNDSPAIAFVSTQLNAYQTIVINIMTLLAPRLLISLRREVYTYVPGVELGTAVVPGAVSNQRDRERTLAWDVQNGSFEMDEIDGELWSREAQNQLVSEVEIIVADEVIQELQNSLSTLEGGHTHVGSSRDFEVRSENGATRMY